MISAALRRQTEKPGKPLLWGGSMRLWPTSSRLVAYSLVAASLSLSHRISSQTTTSGALTGVIADQSNAVVPNVEIEFTGDQNHS